MSNVLDRSLIVLFKVLCDFLKGLGGLAHVLLDSFVSWLLNFLDDLLHLLDCLLGSCCAIVLVFLGHGSLDTLQQFRDHVWNVLDIKSKSFHTILDIIDWLESCLDSRLVVCLGLLCGKSSLFISCCLFSGLLLGISCVLASLVSNTLGLCCQSLDLGLILFSFSRLLILKFLDSIIALLFSGLSGCRCGCLSSCSNRFGWRYHLTIDSFLHCLLLHLLGLLRCNTLVFIASLSIILFSSSLVRRIVLCLCFMIR